MRNLQIGVIGSMADMNYSAELVDLAGDIGKTIASYGATLVFGAEKDENSLPTIAAKNARNNGGLTVGITYEKGLNIYDPDSASVVIATGMIRGGGREMVEALCCDGIIAINGGSGTLNEITVAYQANIPIVLMKNTGGWTARLEEKYLDERRRYKFHCKSSPKEAIDEIIRMIQKH